LECFLLVADGVGPLHRLELRGRGDHGVCGLLHILFERGEGLVAAGDVATVQTAGQGGDLLAKFGLHVAKEFTGVIVRLGGGGLIVLLLPGGGDELLLAA